MAVLPLPPPDLEDFRDSEPTASIALAQDRAQLVADLATAASRVESLISATCQAYDDTSTGRTSDLRRKSQRVTDMLQLSRDEARKLLELAYAALTEMQR